MAHLSPPHAHTSNTTNGQIPLSPKYNNLDTRLRLQFLLSTLFDNLPEKEIAPGPRSSQDKQRKDQGTLSTPCIRMTEHPFQESFTQSRSNYSLIYPHPNMVLSVENLLGELCENLRACSHTEHHIRLGTRLGLAR
jgi:hypothetical protein